jgi:phage tail sheath protein FI
MPEYLSPGVYVEEVPSSIKPIAGVSTSTAAFIGVVPNQITMLDENPNFDPTHDPGDDNPRFFTWKFPVPDDATELTPAQTASTAAEADLKEKRAAAGKDAKAFRESSAKAAALRNAVARAHAHQRAGELADVGQPVLCTTFGDFTRAFGGFSTDGLLPRTDPPPAPDPKAIATMAPGQSQLAHGVYGFFNNGGTRCYVMRFRSLDDLRNPENLLPFEAIDEISLVAAPGITDPVVQSNIVDHCTNMSDRFAILDGPESPTDLTLDSIREAHNTDYGALYFPWIKVFDEPTQLVNPDSDGEIYVAPSGHMAGIYSRVDHERGVHKAPANEVVRGALDVEVQISRALQDGLNPGGVNCIRNMNNNITVWGARTIGGDFNADLKYINVRRTLLFLRKSIDHGTQWVVFEPNDRTLWAKIVRNVTAFLTVVWRDGALFGSTPAEAFYVKCDDETNPPEDRDIGRVTTEIGVAIVRPAEFVIFRISQWGGPQAQ